MIHGKNTIVTEFSKIFWVDRDRLFQRFTSFVDEKADIPIYLISSLKNQLRMFERMQKKMAAREGGLIRERF